MKNINDVIRFMKKRSMMNYDINMIISHELWDHIINSLDSCCLKKGLPKKSGEYLCLCDNGRFSVLHYSNVHRAFNCHDEHYNPRYTIKVDMWCELPELPEELRKGGQDV